MKLFSKTTLFAASVALLATSCSSDADENRITSQTLSGYFNIITNTSTGQTETFTGVSYGVEYNYDTATANISISGLKLPGEVSYPAMTTGALGWSADNDGWKNVSATSVLLSATNFANVPKINNFVFNLRDRWIEDDAYTCSTEIRYTVDDTYKVLSLPRQRVESGITTVKYLNSPAPDYSTDDCVYVIELDLKSGLADLTVNEFSLSDDLEIQAVAIKDVPYVIDTATGRITMTKADGDATIVGAPIDSESSKMKVKDLTVTVDSRSFNASYRVEDKTETYSVMVKG